jgi:hypothetical protein
MFSASKERKLFSINFFVVRNKRDNPGTRYTKKSANNGLTYEKCFTFSVLVTSKAETEYLRKTYFKMWKN